MTDLLETFARAHVLVVHLPIGLLFFAAAATVFLKKEGRAALDFAVGAAALMAAMSPLRATLPARATLTRPLVHWRTFTASARSPTGRVLWPHRQSPLLHRR